MGNIESRKAELVVGAVYDALVLAAALGRRGSGGFDSRLSTPDAVLTE